MFRFDIYESNRNEELPEKVSFFKDFIISKGGVFDSSRPDIVFVFGGDGSLLNAIKIHSAHLTSFMLINAGTLGFYREYDLNELDKFYKEFDFDKLVREEHKLLEIDDIYLHDGSYWKIKDCFYELFKGTRNALKPTPVEGTIDENGEPAEDEPKYAEVGIQSTYSCKHGAICECNVSAGVDDERNYVYKTVSDNVLHILDAGYVSFDLFGEIDSKCGYFICKLRGNSAGCIKSCKLGNEDLTADFAGKKLSHKMVRDFKRAELLDMTVEFNGKEYRVIRIYSKKHQKSQFLITNIRNSRITAKAIKMLYKIPWQIELEFKNLKSCDKLRGATTGVLNIMLSMLLLSLIVNLIQVLYTFVLQIKSKAKLSLYRISYYAGESFKKFVKALIYCSFKKFEVSLKSILEFTKPYERVKQSVQKELEFKTLESTISAIKLELDKSRVESIEYGF